MKNTEISKDFDEAQELIEEDFDEAQEPVEEVFDEEKISCFRLLWAALASKLCKQRRRWRKRISKQPR